MPQQAEPFQSLIHTIGGIYMGNSSIDGATSREIDRTVYRLPFSRIVPAYFILAFGGLMAGFFIWFPLRAQRSMTGEYPWMVLVGLLFFDMCAFFFVTLVRARLVTSPLGIEYHGMGITLRSPWQDVVGLDKVRQGRESPDSLITNVEAEMSWYVRASLGTWPVLKPLGFIVAILSAHPVARGSFDVEKMGRSIPLGFFDNGWRHSALGEDIRRNAPQVFEKRVTDKAADIRSNVDQERSASFTNNATDVRSSSAEYENKRFGWTNFIVPVLIVAQVLFAFRVAPSIYRASQPLLGAADPLPGQPFQMGVIGPKSLSADGRFLGVARREGQVEMVSVPDGVSRFNISLPKGPNGSSQIARSLAMSADGKLIAAGDEYQNVFVWRVADAQLLHTLSVQQPADTTGGTPGGAKKGDVYDVAFSPDNKRLAAVAAGSRIIVWNVDDGMVVSTIKSSESLSAVVPSAKLLFDPSGQTLISLIQGTIETWHAQNGSSIGKFELSYDPIESMAMTADGVTLALGTLYGGIYLWDVSKRTISKTIKERQKPGPGSPAAIFGITISPDGKTAVSGSTEGGLQFWNVDGGDPVNMRDQDGGTVRWLTFTPDGSTLIYAKYSDSSVWLWRR